MRLAFQHFGGDTWMAGNELIQNMCLALRTLGPDCPALVLVVGLQTGEQDYSALAARFDQVLRAEVRVPDQAYLKQLSLGYHFKWWLRTRLLKAPIRPAPHPLSDVLLGQHIDGFFSLATAEAPLTSVATVIWLPDFQHRRFPDNFSQQELVERDNIFMQNARAANRLLVTSADVRRDLETFASAQSSKACIIPYVADVPAAIYSEDPRVGLADYHLPEKFIYLPNQFWQHKNHQLVLEALHRLSARGVRPQIVSTGNPTDYRQPAHFAKLMQMLSQMNIREQFIYLGQVPRIDVFRLMRQSVCVLNPSKFEGLGLSAAESKSLGKRVLVSDLASLREQAVPGADYFDPNDADDLAGKLESIWTTTSPGPDRLLEAAAQAELPRRQAAYGRALLQLFEAAQADFKRRAAVD